MSKSKTKELYSVKDKSTDSFQLQGYLEYAESLGLLINRDPASTKALQGVEDLVRKLPVEQQLKKKNTAKSLISSVGTEIEEDDRSDYTDNFNDGEAAVRLSEESQASVLALCHFVHTSKGMFSDRVLPQLLNVLKTLPRCKWNDKCKITPDFFTYHFVSMMREIGNILEVDRPRINNVLYEVILAESGRLKQSSEEMFLNSKNAMRVLFGLFKSLSEGLPKNFDPEPTAQLLQLFIALGGRLNQDHVHVKQFQGKTIKSMLVMVINIMYQITLIQGADNSENLKVFIKHAYRNITSPDSLVKVLQSKSQASGVKLFSSSIDLVVRCATLLHGTYERDTLEPLINLLDAIPTKTFEEFKNNKDLERSTIDIIKGIQQLSHVKDTTAVNPELSSIALRSLREFIERSNSRPATEKAVAAFCNILVEDYVRAGPSNGVIDHTINVLTNLVFLDRDEGSNDRNSKRVSLLTQCALALNNPQITSVIVPVLVSYFNGKKQEGSTSEGALYLAMVAHLSTEGYKEIVELIFGMYQNTMHSSDTTLGNLLSDCITIINKNLTDPDLRVNLLVRSLRLFNKLAAELQAKSQQIEVGAFKVVNQAVLIGILLPAIAAQLKTLKMNINDPDVNLQKLFRATWFYCIWYGFVDESIVSGYSGLGPEIYEACLLIANNAPLLLRGKQSNFLETEKELNALLEGILTTITLGQLQNKLHQITEQVPLSSIRRFTFVQTMFLLEVYYLETMRVKNGSLEYIFSYLEDHALTTIDLDFTKCLRIITDQVFLKWREFILMVDIDRRTLIVEREMYHLFKSYVNRSDQVSKAARDYISQVTKQFQTIWWSERCITTLLDLTSALHQGINVGNTTKVVSVEIPITTGHDAAQIESIDVIYLPENRSDANQLYEKIKKLTTEWIKSSTSIAPNIVNQALEEYMNRFTHTMNGSLQHVGYAMAMYLSTPREIDIGFDRLDRRRGLSAMNEHTSYSVTQSMAVKSHHMGEIYAMQQSAIATGRSMDKILIDKLTNATKKYREMIRIHDSQINSIHDPLISISHQGSDEIRLKSCLLRQQPIHTDFDHYMQLTTAYIIQSKSPQLHLMQWLIWTPVMLFTKSSFQTAIYCWKWLAASRPELEIDLLTEMFHAWVYAIQQGYGLFSGDRKNSDSDIEDDIIELSVAKSTKQKPHTCDDAPHRLWINYLSERFQALQNSQHDVLVIFINMIMRAVQDVTKFSRDYPAMGSRFRLCLWGILVARKCLDYHMNVVLMRDHIYAVVLNYFQLHPTWHPHHSESNEDLVVLQELEYRLKIEKSTLQKLNIPNGNSSNQLIVDDGISDSKQSIRSGGSHGRDRSVTGTGSIFLSYMKLSPSIDNMSNASGSHRGTQIMNLRKATAGSNSADKLMNANGNMTSSMIELILLLIEHEISRMVLWRSPHQGDSDLNVSQPQDVNLASRWKVYVRTAWNYSPKFAIQLAIRFPMETIRSELTRLVTQHASEVTHLHEAASYLINQQNIEQDAKELQHLLYWSPTTLSQALLYLNAPFVHNPLVGQYAIRSLKKFNAQAVVFYLPQLIQCLRHDQSGQLVRYLIDLVRKNVMFTHQLIWTLRTEIIDYDNLTPEESAELTAAEHSLSKICHALYLQVLGELVFDERAKRLYEEEFYFFDQITAISGALVPYPKDQRPHELVKMVRERILNKPLTKNLYTPTNTNCRIKYFDPTRSLTLKSAKKVPILIPFWVELREPDLDIGQDQESQTQVDFENPDLNGLVLQPCIFKMGDDCRQDQLALQIISMFKRIFENMNLPLYLFPYRVITTGRGMGIIEVIPNSSSRHQIGTNYEGNLYDYFLKKYGHESSIPFQIARKNFIESMAAYSVVSYILAIKDRHNGNIMVDEDGHIIHIDFGFLFDIMPGGNFGIEKQVPFKLTQEFLLIMGEKLDRSPQPIDLPIELNVDPDVSDAKVKQTTYEAKVQQHSEPFNLFVDLCVMGFLAARDHMHNIVSVVEVMLQSELPCFTKDSIKNLKYRMCADKSEKEAVRFFKGQIDASYKNIFSVIYDQYQKRVEGVNC